MVTIVGGAMWVVAVCGYYVLVGGSGWLEMVEEGSWRTVVVIGTLQLLRRSVGSHTS